MLLFIIHLCLWIKSIFHQSAASILPVAVIPQALSGSIQSPALLPTSETITVSNPCFPVSINPLTTIPMIKALTLKHHIFNWQVILWSEKTTTINKNGRIDIVVKNISSITIKWVYGLYSERMVILAEARAFCGDSGSLILIGLKKIREPHSGIQERLSNLFYIVKGYILVGKLPVLVIWLSCFFFFSSI